MVSRTLYSSEICRHKQSNKFIMKRLATLYSKEIAKALGKIAVYLPGEQLQVGDIIRFPYGKTSLFKPVAPLGSFIKISSLSHLGITDLATTTSNSPDSYRFTSKDAVQLEFDTQAQAQLANPALPQAHGSLHIKMANEGALCFFALNCYKTQLDNLAGLEHEINSMGKRMVWEDTFLVTSVTIAQKAMIIQSNSAASELVLSGDLQGLQSHQLASLHADAKIKVQRQKGDILVKDWSDEVTVFMDVMRFDPQVFEMQEIEKQAIFATPQTATIRLTTVLPNELYTIT